MNRARLHLQRTSSAGLSLIELMVAMALGLLVSLGIVTLFGSTSQTNRVQNGLARLQENGRYVMSRMASDLLGASGQYCSNSGGGATQTANGNQMPLRAPVLHVAGFQFPDSSWPPFAPGLLSPRYFMQGYDCSGGTCLPADPKLPSGIPEAGQSAGDRVEGSDVLTVRYQRGEGWLVTACDLATGAVTVAGTPTIANGDAVLVSDCNTANIFAASVAGSTITPPSTEPPMGCPAAASLRDSRIREGEPRLFNFSKDFTTVTYYLRLRADGNPDRAERLVPVLIRREPDSTGKVQDNEIAEGVERLDFLYGVEDGQGRIAFLTADEVTAKTDCSRAPEGFATPDGGSMEPGCAWRSVKSIEIHALLNTVNDIDIADVDTAYRYSVDGDEIKPPPATLPDGLPAGRMMRREFVRLITVRNFSN